MIHFAPHIVSIFNGKKVKIVIKFCSRCGSKLAEFSEVFIIAGK